MKLSWKRAAMGLIVMSTLIAGGCGIEQSEPIVQEDDVNKKVTEGSLGVDYMQLLNDQKLADAAESITDLPAPDFTVKGIDGEVVSLSDFKGKQVVLEFAQSTCGACQHSHEAVERFIANHPDVKVMQIFDFEENGAQAYANMLGADQSTLFNGDGTIAVKYNALFTPTFVFIDEKGIVRYMTVGAVDTDTLEGHYDFFNINPDLSEME